MVINRQHCSGGLRPPKYRERAPLAQAGRLCNGSAFTLIEMLAVLVIVGAFVVVALPAFTSLGRSAALPGALRQIDNELSLARQFAITHRVQTEMRFTNSLNAVSIFTNVGPNEIQVDKWNYLPLGTIAYFPPSAVPPVTVVTNLVVFTPTGGTTNVNGVSICVREGSFDTNGYTYFGINSNCGTVSIDNLLGRISIQRP